MNKTRDDKLIQFIKSYGNRCEWVGYHEGLEEDDPLRIECEKSRNGSFDKIVRHLNKTSSLPPLNPKEIKMKNYIGAKIIKAEPMDQITFINADGKGPDTTVRETQEPRDGYRVEYPDGYVSWSPKNVFETAYREITDSEFDFMALIL